MFYLLFLIISVFQNVFIIERVSAFLEVRSIELFGECHYIIFLNFKMSIIYIYCSCIVKRFILVV